MYYLVLYNLGYYNVNRFHKSWCKYHKHTEDSRANAERDIAGFNVLYYVLYCLFLSTCVLQSVCVHTMDFVSANKQIN